MYNVGKKERDKMFKFSNNNEEVGKYLNYLIAHQYGSKRDFCREYIKMSNEEPNEENIANMANRLTQITKGNKAIQTYDLPYFTALLDVSCEQILSAGEYSVPLAQRQTNYSIASSKVPTEWEKYINNKDKPILNADEYGKTVLDYAIEFGNYAIIKYLVQHKYIWFDGGNPKDYRFTFGAATSIERRQIGEIDYTLQNQLATNDSLRTKIIVLAVDSDDMEMLNKLRAREEPQLYTLNYLNCRLPEADKNYDKLTLQHIANSSEAVLDYFTDTFTVKSAYGSERTYTFLFPQISKLIDTLIAQDSPFAEKAIKKAIKHNNDTYQRLCNLILSIKNDEYYRLIWEENCKQEFMLQKEGDFVGFRAIYSTRQYDGIITNIAHTAKKTSSAALKPLVEALNATYEKIKNITDNLEEIANDQNVL